LRGRAWQRLLGLLPIGIAAGLHTLHNYVAVHPDAAGESFNTALESQLWLIPLLALAVAMALDLKTLHWAKAVVPLPPLSALHYSLTAPPWTTWIALRFLLVRRSLWYLAARSTPAAAEPLRQLVSTFTMEMSRGWQGLPKLHLRFRPARLLLYAVPIALAVPAVLLLIVGSFPSHANLQKSLTTGSGAKLIYWLAIAALLWLLWRLLASVIEIRRTAALSIGTAVTTAKFHFLVAAGAVTSSAALLYLHLTGTQLNAPLRTNHHLLDALNDFLLVAGLALFLLGVLAAMPPVGLALVGGGTTAVAVSTEVAVALGLSGVLMMATGTTGGNSGSRGGGSSGGGNQGPKGVPQREPAPKPQVSDPKLRRLVDNLWKGHTRPDRTGDGTTMDAARNELMTGRLTQGKDHVGKARQTKRDLWRWTKEHPNASRHDHKEAEKLMDWLENVLNTKRQS
jgi:hypothetical protein